MKIDAVIPWVDGSDPELNAKRASYGSDTEFKRNDVAGATRFANVGEINYCVRSLNIHAPFLNKIYIVTDGQDPHVESTIPVEVVDHKVIFRDYEQYLPVFNSTSIETMIHRIPGLSEHYILLNDDFFLCRDIKEEDFFTEDGKVVCYSRIFLSAWETFLNMLTNIKDGYQRSTFKLLLLKGSELQGKKHSFFFYLVHTPRPLLKSTAETFFGVHPEAVAINLKDKFRSPDQFQVQALQYMLLWNQKKCKVVNPARQLLFIQHWKGVDYLKKKFEWADRVQSVKFACFGSLDQASEEERQMVFSWMDSKLNQ